MLAVFFQKGRQHVAALGRRRHLQLGRVLGDLGDDAVQELVVELDAALALRLLEGVVDEGRLRFVSGFVARECRNRRIEILIPQQGKERGTCSRARRALDRQRKSRVLDVAHTHTRLHVGRRRSIHHHFRAAVVHVVMRRHDRDARPFETHLKIFRCRRGELTQVQERGPRRGHDDSCRAGLQLGKILLADRPRDAQLIAIDACHLCLLCRAVRVERDCFSVLFERDRQRGEVRIRRGCAHVERAGLSDGALRFVDGERRRSAASRDDICDGAAEDGEDDENAECAQHRFD